MGCHQWDVCKQERYPEIEIVCPTLLTPRVVSNAVPQAIFNAKSLQLSNKKINPWFEQAVIPTDP